MIIDSRIWGKCCGLGFRGVDCQSFQRLHPPHSSSRSKLNDPSTTPTWVLALGLVANMFWVWGRFGSRCSKQGCVREC